MCKLTVGNWNFEHQRHCTVHDISLVESNTGTVLEAHAKYFWMMEWSPCRILSPYLVLPTKMRHVSGSKVIGSVAYSTSTFRSGNNALKKEMRVIFWKSLFVKYFFVLKWSVNKFERLYGIVPVEYAAKAPRAVGKRWGHQYEKNFINYPHWLKNRTKKDNKNTWVQVIPFT